MMGKIRQLINRREVRNAWRAVTKTDRVNVNEAERLVSLIGGASLVVYGLSRCSLKALGWLCAAGSYLLYRGLTGHCLAYKYAHISTASQTAQPQFRAGDPINQKLQQQKHVETTIERENVVDEVGLESFPASDPPAWHSGTA